MKKLLTLVLILCIGVISGNAYGQETKTQNKKGGFAVGGYDNTRQEKSTVTKRSVVIPEEAAPAEKAMEDEAPAPPAPAAAEAAPQKEVQSKDKEAIEGKDAGQTTAKDAKVRQKTKKNARTKEKQK